MYNEQVSMSVNGSDATLTTYFIDNLKTVLPERTRPCVVVLPGGGYNSLSEREAEPIALAMVAQGFHACVLRYSVAPATWPQALLEAMRAVSWLRTHAEEFHVDAGRIILTGFSAGGHLAACAGAFWDKAFVTKALGGTAEQYRPDGLVLGYPVITSGEYAHHDSFVKLTGDDDGEGRSLSIERCVTPVMPPVFVWATATDELVPVENTLLLTEALQRAGVSFEAHVFPRGTHGVALGTLETADPSVPRQAEWVQPQAAKWVGLAADWIRAL